MEEKALHLVIHTVWKENGPVLVHVQIPGSGHWSGCPIRDTKGRQGSGTCKHRVRGFALHQRPPEINRQGEVLKSQEYVHPMHTIPPSSLATPEQGHVTGTAMLGGGGLCLGPTAGTSSS